MQLKIVLCVIYQIVVKQYCDCFVLVELGVVLLQLGHCYCQRECWGTEIRARQTY